MSTFRRDIFSSVASDLTSETYFTGDAEELTVQLQIASATTVTLQGSNATGFREAFVEDDWSTLTTVAGVAANSIYNIEPGFRWMRVIKESATSADEVILSGRNDDGR